MKKLFFLFTAVFLINGCSNDENSDQEQIIDGGIIYPSQIVTIEVNGIIQNEYSALLGDNLINISKLSNQELFFYVPTDIEIGESTLSIPNLENKKIQYNIKSIVISNTVEETLEPLITNISNYKNDLIQEPNTSETLNTISSINLFETELIEASNEEKKLLADFYYVNKQLIDSVYLIDYTNPLGRNVENLSDYEVFNNFAAAIPNAILLSAAAFAVIEIPFVNVTAAAIAMNAWLNAYELFYEFKNRKLFKLDFVIDNISSSLSDNNIEAIVYSHNLGEEDLIIMKAKNIDDSYSSSTLEVISDFFDKQFSYNTAISSLNTVISFLNNFFPSSNIQLIEQAALDESIVGSLVIDDEIFEDITYSVSSTNVEISEMYLEDNVLNTTLSILDLDQVSGDFLETTLNFHYQNEFNDIQGSYPIIINKEEEEIDILGNWEVSDTGIMCSVDPFQGGTIIFYSDGTVEYGAFNEGTYTLNGSQLTFQTVFDQNNIPVSCLDGSTQEVDIYSETSFIGDFDGENFNGELEMSITSSDINCVGADNFCDGSVTLSR